MEKVYCLNIYEGRKILATVRQKYFRDQNICEKY